MTAARHVTADTGISNPGDTCSLGASGSGERAFGGLRSGSLVPTIGASFVDGNGVTVTSLMMGYSGEQWRQGVSDRGAADRLDFQYGLDAPSVSTGTWIGVDALDFNAPHITASVGSLDGNAAAKRAPLTSTIAGLLRNFDGCDVVHVKPKFAVQVSDHDPVGAGHAVAALGPLGGLAGVHRRITVRR